MTPRRVHQKYSTLWELLASCYSFNRATPNVPLSRSDHSSKLRQQTQKSTISLNWWGKYQRLALCASLVPPHSFPLELALDITETNLMNLLDAYNTLEINQLASPEEVKSAYRRLALRFHPDKNPSPDAKDKFQRISTAYARVLKSFERPLKTRLSESGEGYYCDKCDKLHPFDEDNDKREMNLE
ncbi:12398_t:CDS:2, partial [Acaulospora colombiana]